MIPVPTPSTNYIEYQLLASGPICDRTFSVSNFMVDGPIELKNWQQPIHIARSGTDTKTRKLPLPDPNQPPQKRQEARKNIQKSRRGFPFHLEDASKKNVFNGHMELDQSNRFEPNQSNKYVIFKRENGVFKVIPCDDWYSFKRESKNIPLSYEDAERILKERVKGERNSEKDKDKEKTTASPVEPPKRNTIMAFIKKEEQKEIKPTKDRFNATGEVVELDEEDLSGLGRPKAKKKDKGENMDYDDDFDTDNKEDKLSVKSFEKKKLSSEAKEVKKLMKGEEDDFSDDEEKEFIGVEDLLEKKIKEPKAGEKRAADTQVSGATKKARTDGSAVAGSAPNAISEKEVEKQIRDYLTINGKVPLSKLISKFRSIINSIGKDTFIILLKRVTEAKKEDGQVFIFLKDDQYRDFR